MQAVTAAGEYPSRWTFSSAQITEQGVIASLRRDACSDRLLLLHASESEIAEVVERSVHDLWQASRIKSFVGVLALRDVRGIVAASEGSKLRAFPRVQQAPALDALDDDELTLSDDGAAT